MGFVDRDGFQQEERRGGYRRKTLLGATASFDRGYRSSDAIIRNMSPTGARLDFGDWPLVPDEFDLKWTHGRRPVRIVWRNQTQIGVAFV